MLLHSRYQVVIKQLHVSCLLMGQNLNQSDAYVVFQVISHKKGGMRVLPCVAVLPQLRVCPWAPDVVLGLKSADVRLPETNIGCFQFCSLVETNRGKPSLSAI